MRAKQLRKRGHKTRPRQLERQERQPVTKRGQPQTKARQPTLPAAKRKKPPQPRKLPKRLQRRNLPKAIEALGVLGVANATPTILHGVSYVPAFFRENKQSQEDEVW